MSQSVELPSAPSTIHAVSRACRCPQTAALALLISAQGIARWNLGLWNTREVELGLFTGESLFGGGTGWARVRLDREAGRIDYLVGASPDQLIPRIEARVLAGAPLGYPDDVCLVSLIAWRTADMSDERWYRLARTHETEIELIRSLLEAEPSASASWRGAPGLTRNA